MKLIPDVKVYDRKNSIPFPDFKFVRGAAILFASGVFVLSFSTLDVRVIFRAVFVIASLPFFVFAVKNVLTFCVGYLKYKACIPVWDTGKGIFDTFAAELNDYYSGDDIPDDCDSDMAIYFDLQKKRLENNSLTMNVSVQPLRGSFGPNTKVCRSRWYKAYMTGEAVCRRILITKDSKELYEDKKNTVLYDTVIETPQSEDLKEARLCCPGCGALSSVYDLQEGCKYCGASFNIKDLFPRVTNVFFMHLYNHSPVNIQAIAHASVLICMGAIFLFGVLNSGIEGFLPGRLLLSYLAALLYGGFLGLIIADILILKNVFFSGDRIKKVPLLSAFGTAVKLNKLMGKYDPYFSFELFEGKIISMIRLCVFSDDKDNLAMLNPNVKTDERFDRIIDMIYTHTLTLRNFSVKDGTLYITMRTWWINLCTVDDDIKKYSDRIDISVSRSLSNIKQPSFSIAHVSCPSCGGSFDAMHLRHCPYCDSEYHAQNDGWYIEDIRLLR